MEAIFLKLIEQLNSSVFTLVSILVLVFIGIYKIGGVVTYFEEIKVKNEKFDAAIDNIKESISEVKATTKLLYEVHLQTVKGRSPLSLTSLGEEISTKVSVKEKISNHWTDIKAKMGKRNPNNPYDIQVVSLDIAQDCFDSLFNEDEKEQIKSLAYEKGLNLREIYPIIGIEIRNKYFEERKIKTKEVDEHHPN